MATWHVGQPPRLSAMGVFFFFSFFFFSYGSFYGGRGSLCIWTLWEICGLHHLLRWSRGQAARGARETPAPLSACWAIKAQGQQEPLTGGPIPTMQDKKQKERDAKAITTFPWGRPNRD